MARTLRRARTWRHARSTRSPGGDDAHRTVSRPTATASQLLSRVVMGAVVAVTQIALASSFAALVFSGRLAPHLPAGIGLSLFAATVTTIVIALGSSFPGTVGRVQDTTTTIAALMAAAIAARLAASPTQAFLTVVVALGLSTIITGVFFLLIGSFRLGNLIRFIPYPVMAGFLAGTGWLLIKGGMVVLTGAPLSFSALAPLVHSQRVFRWLPSVAAAAIVLVSVRRLARPLVVPAAVIGGGLLFYAVVLLNGQSLAGIRAGGWLLGPFPSGRLWHPWITSALSRAGWGTVLSEAALLPTLLAVAVIHLLMSCSSIELGVGKDLDLNRELRVAGVANVLSGLGGGMVGYHSNSLTLLASRGGATGRLVAVITAATCAVTLLAGASFVALTPKPLIGGVLVFLGLSLLVEWVYDSRSRLPLADYLIVILILVVIAVVGFLPGVGVGIVAAVILFAVSYSRNDVVKHALSGRSYRSNLDRSPRQEELLRHHGDDIFILELQGYIFFGTADGLLQRVNSRVADPSARPLRSLILDFRQVWGLDSSAANCFRKARRIGLSEGFTLVFTGVPTRVAGLLRTNGVAEAAELEAFADLDRGVEWCEDRILEAAGLPLDDREDARQWAVELEALLGHLPRIDVPAGHVLIREGDPSDDLYILASGRLTAALGGGDGPGLRLRTMGPGAVVGEISLYLGTPRTATVTSDAPSSLYHLSRAEIDRLQTEEPAMAAALHRLFATSLAGRLAGTLRTIDAVLG